MEFRRVEKCFIQSKYHNEISHNSKIAKFRIKRQSKFQYCQRSEEARCNFYFAVKFNM